MRPDEVAALGGLASDLVAGTTERVKEIHAGISRRVFGLLGPAALPVRMAHDAIAAAAYTGTREATKAAVTAAALAASAAVSGDAPSLSESADGRRVLGALNAAVGDRLERAGSPLAMPMSLHCAGRVAGPRMAVFIHGLGRTEEAWSLHAERHVPYGVRLEAELGYTPVYVRYNTGRHVSENGRELAQLLEREIPHGVNEIALVGHAMGGLVARAACHYGAGSSWTRRVRHVVMLGAPHSGAPLEQVAATAGAVLDRLPETQAVAKAIDQRSSGIKDLRRGYLVDEDWREDSSHDVPFLASARHYFVSADLNLAVPRGSAWARRGRGPMQFPAEHYAEVAGVSHYDLLNHPAVYAQLYWWLCSRRALPAPRRELPAGQRP